MMNVLNHQIIIHHCATKTAAFLLGERGGFEYKLPADCDWMRRCEKGEGLACFCTAVKLTPAHACGLAPPSE
jgi:hypothetical protein